jgi:hypothetical protein
MNTRPSLRTTADDWGIAAAVSQNGKYSHVHVIINQAKTCSVLSGTDETASLMKVASDAPRQTMGQKPPASVSQIAPLHLKYWPIPTPKMHGMSPNTVTFTMALCRVDELSILCPSKEVREVAQARYIPPSYPPHPTL